MPITIEEIKNEIDVLFRMREELNEAFGDAAFGDELGRALSYVNGGGSLDWEYFNRILTAASLGPVDRRLFERYFPRGINSAEKLHEGVDGFIKAPFCTLGAFTRRSFA